MNKLSKQLITIDDSIIINPIDVDKMSQKYFICLKVNNGNRSFVSVLLKTLQAEEKRKKIFYLTINEKTKRFSLKKKTQKGRETFLFCTIGKSQTKAVCVYLLVVIIQIYSTAERAISIDCCIYSK